MIVSGLLVTLGLAQTPDAGSNTDQANIVKGCLGGSDGNYTVAEDGLRQSLRSPAAVDPANLGHDVNLIGHKASGAASSGAADNSFAVTELNMISDHCAAAAVVHRFDYQPVLGDRHPAGCGGHCTGCDYRRPRLRRLPAHPLRTPQHPLRLPARLRRPSARPLRMPQNPPRLPARLRR